MGLKTGLLKDLKPKNIDKKAIFSFILDKIPPYRPRSPFLDDSHFVKFYRKIVRIAEKGKLFLGHLIDANRFGPNIFGIEF